MPSVATQLAQLAPKPQILIQPDAPPEILLQRPTPVPLVLRWTPPPIPVKTITPAPVPVTVVANVKATIQPPNREVRPADIKISSANFSTTLPTLAPSTTSPIVIRKADPEQHIPETSSKQPQNPNSAQVLSVSDLQVQEGPVNVPLANATSRSTMSDSVGTGQTITSAQGGHGNPASRQTGSGPGIGQPAANGNSLTGTGIVAQAGPASGSAQSGQGSDTGTNPLLNEASITRIHLPKEGQFGVVVVGSSIADQYPETVGIWGGRLVYTVYLHVGPGKAWIMQYSLPNAAQVAANGSPARPDAPWPFDIVRPHLDPNDFTSDALLVHGFVNPAGRFERLAMVFPAGFAKAKFVVNALQQWEFRPARQNGQLASVEVLLIIPEESQ
jgi:hypothetical protein